MRGVFAVGFNPDHVRRHVSLPETEVFAVIGVIDFHAHRVMAGVEADGSRLHRLRVGHAGAQAGDGDLERIGLLAWAHRRTFGLKLGEGFRALLADLRLAQAGGLACRRFGGVALALLGGFFLLQLLRNAALPLGPVFGLAAGADQERSTNHPSTQLHRTHRVFRPMTRAGTADCPNAHRPAQARSGANRLRSSPRHARRRLRCRHIADTIFGACLTDTRLWAWEDASAQARSDRRLTSAYPGYVGGHTRVRGRG